MKLKKTMKPIALFCLMLLACNIPIPANRPDAGATPLAVTQPPVTDEAVRPSGSPLLTMQPGSGYLFATGEVVTGSNPRDVWWNGVGFVPGTSMASAGLLDSPGDVTQFSRSGLAFEQFEPFPGETFVVEVASTSSFVVIRYLSRGDDGEITLEYLYPFGGQVLP